MIALLKKEINQFMSTLTGVLTIVIFLLINSLMMWVFSGDFNIIDYGYENMYTFFTLAPILFLIFIPAVCMRLFSEVYRSGTMEVLVTKPISLWNIVLSKYLAANILVLLAILPTLTYFGSIYFLGETVGNLDSGGILGSYLGLFMLSSAFIAIGVFASTISNNQVIAFLTAITSNAIIYYGFDIISKVTFLQKWDLLISKLGISAHYAVMSNGVIDSRDLLYFMSLCFLFLMLSKTIIQSKR